MSTPADEATMRLEDDELLRGQARYLDDLPPPDAHAAFVRSTIAHGMVSAIDAAAAAAAPGVLAIWTAADLRLRPLRAHAMLDPAYDRPPLADGRVRFVGEPIAVVVADTRAHAVDAAELVVVAYEPRAPVLDPDEALAGRSMFAGTDGPVVFERELPGDGDGGTGTGGRTVVRLRSVNQRVATAPMEPDGAQAEPGPDGGLLVWASTQRVHHVRTAVADGLGIDPALVRVRAPQVGGGFGGKFEPSPETVVIAAAARRLGRSVRWVQTRTENLQSMPHGRAQVQEARLTLDAHGTFGELWIDVLNDAGAYPMVGAVIPMATTLMAPGAYRIRSVAGRGRSVCTNRAPLGAFRGAGRPEATALLERLVDVAAHDLAVDPVELRRRNLVTAAEQPYTSATGMTYDGGDYPALLDELVDRLGYTGLRAEQLARRRNGSAPLLGIGVAMWMDCTPMNRPGEYAAIELLAHGDAVRVRVRDGANDQGQGHRSTWARLIERATGLDPHLVDLEHGDTGAVPTGEGTGSARSMMLAGGAVAAAAEAVAEQGRLVAAHLLEAAPDDIVIGRDGFTVAGTPSRAVSWRAVVEAAAGPTALPPDVIAAITELRGALPGAGIGAAVDFEQPGPTFPSGCHGAVVEVDPETGAVELRRFVAVDDCGTVIHPVLVEGQQHGGVAQGIAQALYEDVVYDADGNPLTSTFAEYGIPSAAELPPLEAYVRPTPSPVNPLGVRGIGQAGAIGSTGAVQNAVVDALAHLGVRHIHLPLTPERVWRAIQAATR
jgi:carbon-monoxide dehydrogenase large subunit